MAAIVILILVFAWIGINLKFLSDSGQSVGKKILKIRIVRTDGSRASLLRLVLLRYGVTTALSVIPYFGSLWALADSLAIFGSEHKCLHDRIADTIVVDVSRSADARGPLAATDELLTKSWRDIETSSPG